MWSLKYGKVVDLELASLERCGMGGFSFQVNNVSIVRKQLGCNKFPEMNLEPEV